MNPGHLPPNPVLLPHHGPEAGRLTWFCTVLVRDGAALVGKESACSSGDAGSILGLEDPPEEGLATHSNILAWRILWTEEPGGLQSMGLQRIGQLNRATTEAT